MILKILAIIAGGSGLLYIINAIGEEISSLAEDTQEYPSCDNCVGQIDSTICEYCDNGSCWEHKNETLHRNI